MGRLDGRVALVTGGSRGIGEAIAGAMAREGARVVIVSRREEGVQAAVERLEAVAPGQVTGRAHHVGHLDQADALVAAVEADVGPVDILVNNAGTNPFFGPMLDTSWAAWDKTFEVNLKGAFALTQAVCRRLVAASKPGSVISLSSILGHTASPGQGVYGMTKAALISMTKTLALELGPAGIRVNAIAPGVVDTRLAAAITGDPALKALVSGRTALGRVASPDEIAGLAVFLASDEASYVTGQTMFVDGGYTSG